MLRFEWRRRWPEGLMTGSVFCCVFVLGGCSSDVARFNGSVLGVMGRSGSHSTPPIPQHGGYGASSTPLSIETSSSSHAGSRRAPPSRAGEVRVAALADIRPQPLGSTVPVSVDGATALPSVRTAAFTLTTAPRPRAIAKGEAIGVQPGDTISGLARRHQVSASELMSANDLTNPNIRPGQRLVLPTGRRAAANSTAQKPWPQAMLVPVAILPRTAAPVAGRFAAPDGAYTVKSGDSLYTIANRHKVSLAELQRANGITEPHKVKAGTLLRMSSMANGSSQPVAALNPSHELAGAEAQHPLQTPIAPHVINSAPKQVAALESTGTATDVGAAHDDSRTAAGAPDTETPSAATQALPAGKFRWPVKGRVIAGFGPKPDGSHNDGVNLAVPLGTDVLAAEAGVVAYADSELKGYGHLILIRHDNGWVTAYAHNDQLLVKRDDRVRRGQVIAKAGKTGTVDQPQVHFEIRQGSIPVDPLAHLE